MTVAYPRKPKNSISTRKLLRQLVVNNREIHLATLNRYRYNEQHSCKDLTEVIESLNGEPRDLVQELCHHVSDEARHSVWLTDLLIDLGADISKPPGVSYIDELDRLLDKDSYQNNLEDGLIAALATINITEKRGCEYFSAHIHVLKEAPQTAENIKIRETLEKIFPEEVGHVRWGNRWLAKIAKKSPEHKRKVEQAKYKYTVIEQMAYESGVDIMAGAELRHMERLLQITNTMPVLDRFNYFIERLPQTLLQPELQMTRLRIAQRAWNQDPQAFTEKFIPLFFNGLK